MTGFSDRCRSEAREGARGLVGCADESFVGYAAGDIRENRDPTNKVAGYTRSATAGSEAGREVAAAMIATESNIPESMQQIMWMEVSSSSKCGPRGYMVPIEVAGYLKLEGG